LIKFRNSILVLTTLFWTTLGLLALLSPDTFVDSKFVETSKLLSLRTYGGAMLAMGLSSVFALWRKQYQYIVLSFLFITAAGWAVGDLVSLLVDGKPDRFTTLTLAFQVVSMVAIRSTLRKR